MPRNCVIAHGIIERLGDDGGQHLGSLLSSHVCSSFTVSFLWPWLQPPPSPLLAHRSHHQLMPPWPRPPRVRTCGAGTGMRPSSRRGRSPGGGPHTDHSSRPRHQKRCVQLLSASGIQHLGTMHLVPSHPLSIACRLSSMAYWKLNRLCFVYCDDAIRWRMRGAPVSPVWTPTAPTPSASRCSGTPATRRPNRHNRRSHSSRPTAAGRRGPGTATIRQVGKAQQRWPYPHLETEGG